MFFDVFQSLCEKKGISCKKAVEEIGLSNSIATKWKRTGAIPKGETINRIAEYFGVTADYLLGKSQAESSADVLDAVDIAFYGEYRELDEDQKETVRDMVRIMRERRAIKQGK